MTTADRILDAAYELVVARGWAKVTMSELSAAAHVSRQSVYNEFGTREGVANALVRREVQTFLAAVDACLRDASTPQVGIVAAGNTVLDMAQENPLVRAVLTGDDSTLLPLLNSEVVIATATDHVRRGLPQADAVTVDTVVRLVISHVVAPGPQRPDIGEVARRLLGGGDRLS